MNEKNSKDFVFTSTPTIAAMLMTLLTTKGQFLPTVSVGIASAASNYSVISVIKKKNQQSLLEVQMEQEIRNEIKRVTEDLYNLIQPQIRTLEERMQNFIPLENEQQLAEKKAELNKLQQEITSLQQRIFRINEENPDLNFKEMLQKDIEYFKLSRDKLEVQEKFLDTQVKELDIQVKELEKKRETLLEIESQITQSQTKLNIIVQGIKTQTENKNILQKEYEDLKEKHDTLENEFNLTKNNLNAAKEDFITIQLDEKRLDQQKNYLKQEINEFETTIELLKIEQQKLEQRIIDINLKNPDLNVKEELEKNIATLTSAKNNYEGELITLKSLINELEDKKEKLQSAFIVTESSFIIKQNQLENCENELKILTGKLQELEQKTNQLELLRVTYDNLLGETQNYQNKIQKLKPEIESLEFQKQQIIQAIKEQENEYQKIETLREELRSLSEETRRYQAENQTLQTNINKLQGVQDGLETQRSEYQEEIQRLENKINQLKGEIDATEQSAANALKALKNPLWINLIETRKTLTENEFLGGFQTYLNSKGLNFSERVISAFHTSLKVQDISALVILAGISGTGKSELPQRYAEFLGACSLVLPVQPRWDSPQDLQGFYNYMEKKYKPTDLMRGLYQFQHNDVMKNRLVIVLLDEMNLAKVEYYFSDFLSKLESRRNEKVYLDLEVGSLALPEKDRKIQIPNQFLFVGTMNEDETTHSLSDKVLDRANVLTFGRPKELKLRENKQNSNNFTVKNGYISYQEFISWRKPINPQNQVVDKITEYINEANQIIEQLGHPFAHRVYQAITSYVINYPGVTEGNDDTFKAALADQFGQKILPKLRGIMVDDYKDELDKFETIINNLADKSLITAFKNAREGSYGQFNWKGLVYED